VPAQSAATRKSEVVVSVDVFENETASFWQAPGMNPAEIETEVFILPAAIGYEKYGNKANSGRWIQWTWQAQNPPGDSKQDLWIVNELFKRVQGLYQAEGGAGSDAILNMVWDYDGPDGEIDIVNVCKELNGYRVADGSLVTNFVGLADDGSTACGNWLYSGYYNNLDNPATKKRIKEKEGLGFNKDWSLPGLLTAELSTTVLPAIWKANPGTRQLLLSGGMKNSRNGLGTMFPIFPAAIHSSNQRKTPLLCSLKGVGSLHCVNALRDGPFPTHFEPADSPVSNLLYPQATFNPASQRFLC
jgi:formate dehydrogenase major subunit